jgi:fucose 4-O-acetylase-like acetyltransferase
VPKSRGKRLCANGFPLSMTPQYNGRIEWIELAKGFAIFLVVFAHLFKFGSLPVPEFYTFLKNRIYNFHMPLFMFLSGCVYFYRGYHLQNSAAALTKLFVQRADRLLVPFFGLALLTVGGKALLRQWFFVEESSFSLLDSFSLIFVNTESSPVFTVWYLFVLFVFAVLTPIVFKLLRGSYPLLLLFAGAIYLIEAPDIFYLNRILSFYIFFVLGGISASAALPLGTVPRGAYYAVAAVFLLSLIPPIDRFYALLVCGLLSCFVVPRMVMAARGHIRQGLLFLAEHTMAIYLFNVASIGLVKAVYIKTFSYSIEQFYILAPLMLIGGILLPVLLKQAVASIQPTQPIARYLA